MFIARIIGIIVGFVGLTFGGILISYIIRDIKKISKG